MNQDYFFIQLRDKENNLRDTIYRNLDDNLASPSVPTFPVKI